MTGLSAAEWHASPTRALDEAAAAPADWRDWRVELLAGSVRPDVGAALGTTLGSWHGTTHDDPALVGGLDGMDRMESLRLVPFHEVVAARHADLAAEIGAAADELREVRSCLVHGDFSPKSVLVGAGGPHRPGPTLGDRLRGGSRRQSGVRPGLHAGPPAAQGGGLHDNRANTADEFLVAYRRSLAESDLAAVAVEAQLGVHTGCLLLARIDATSLVDYLDAAAIERVRAWGRRLVAGELPLAEVWGEVTDG